MTYRPVIDHVAVPAYLDPFCATLFVAAFIAAALLTRRRPAYGIAALILSIPVDLPRVVFATTLTLPKCVLVGVLLGLVAHAGALRGLQTRPARWILGALAVFIVATALTAIDAVHRGAVLRETLKWIEYATVFASAACCYALDGDDAVLIDATAVAALLVAFCALAQEVAGAPSGIFVGTAVVPRIAGLLEGPNQLSAYCAVATGVLGAWVGRRRTPLVTIAIALVIFTDVLTFSRAGLFALALVATIVVLAARANAGVFLRPAAAGLAAGVAGCAWWAFYAHTPGILRTSLAPSAYAGGVGNRGELWRAAYRMWLDRPVFGVGAGNFELDLPFYGVYGVRTHANSWYLQSLAEGGIVLFLSTVALALATVAAFVRRPPIASLRRASPWIVAAVGVSVGMIVHNVVDDVVFFTKVGGAWWLLLGIAAAAPLNDEG